MFQDFLTSVSNAIKHFTNFRNREPVLGIDFGNTTTCVAVFHNGKINKIINDQGSRITDSCVAFTDDGRLIGDAARNQAAFNPENTIFGARRLIGRSFSDATVQSDMKLFPFKVVEVEGRPRISVEVKGETSLFSPEEIISMVLAKIKEAAEAFLGQRVSYAVIAVPAHYNELQQQATIQAGRLAGLTSMIIEEPAAASLAHCFQAGHILVLDLGGGTYDVTILATNTSALFELKAATGDAHLSGEHFDKRLVSHCVQEFNQKHKLDISGDPRAIARLQGACESAKRILSSFTEASVEIDSLFQGIDFNIKISRAMFEDLCQDLFRLTIPPVESALSEAKLDKGMITNVILVGGSTRIPKLHEILREFFNGKELQQSANPDEDVAYGAALLAAVNRDGVPISITPVSLGVETCDGVMTPLVAQGTAIPTRTSQIFTTASDNQTGVDILVFDGEGSGTKDNRQIGKLRLTGIKPAPRGVPQIDVTFDIDGWGVLLVTAQDKSTGRSDSVRIKLQCPCVNHDDIEHWDAETNKGEDGCISELDSNEYRLEKYVPSANEVGDKLSTSVKDETRNPWTVLMKWLGGLQRIFSSYMTKASGDAQSCPQTGQLVEERA